MFKNENKFELTASGAIALVAVASFMAGSYLLFKYGLAHMFTGFAFWSFTVLLVSFLVVTGSLGHRRVVYGNQGTDPWKIALGVSFLALVSFGLLSRFLEFG
jgi:multisubunit Na+/H+ antiporter MnhC subunit